MSLRRLSRIAMLAGLCVGATALTGLPWADASSPRARAAASDTGKPLLKCIKYDVDDQPVCGILVKGPRGKAGRAGKNGKNGLNGANGPQGAQGPQGVQGIQGPRGIAGAPNTPVVYKGSIGRMTQSPTGPSDAGKTITSVAQCQPGSDTPFAYGGGAVVSPDDNNGADIVPLQSSFMGSFNGGGATPVTTNGATSPDAWEADAVINTLHAGDTVTIQAYVICGP